MLKAIRSQAPQPTRQIWDINLLIGWIQKNPPKLSSLFEVSRHLALLLLLASGRRVHDLTLLHTDNLHMQIFEKCVIFWPNFGSKTDSNHHLQSGWKLVSNTGEALFDIPAWVKKLRSMSLSRQGAGFQLTSLFITTCGKVAPASRSVIAGWVKTALTSAGICASPGSLRSAVSSFRFDSAVPLDTILCQGNWTGAQNFFRHYYKPCPGRKPVPLPHIIDSFEPVT